jgi:hypothetical protein
MNNLCCCPSIKSDAQSATQTVTVKSVTGLVKLDTATATQVIYSASSVAEKKAGLVQYAGSVKNLQCVAQL